MYLGAKIGVLGNNGAGKSTLLRIMAGVDAEFDGDFSVNDGIKIGYLAQEPELNDGETVLENVEPALAGTRAMVKEFEDVSAAMCEPDADMDKLMARMDELQSALDACNGWEVDRQLERAMDAVLSGGERRRVALCRLLLADPDVLLLDEPTNHLDAASVAWLERFLYDFRYAKRLFLSGKERRDWRVFPPLSPRATHAPHLDGNARFCGPSVRQPHAID